MEHVSTAIEITSLKVYKTVEEIQKDADKVKQAGDNWFTNVYIGSDLFQRFISKGIIKGNLSDKTAILIAELCDMTRLYFFTVDFKDFEKSFKKILPCLKYPISTEIYTDSRNYAQVDTLQKHLTELGFKHHATQIRLTRLSKNNFYGEIEPQWYADKNDCDEIYQMLRNTFDVRCDQIPNVEELRERAVNREILKINADGKIASAIIFHRKTYVAEWVFWLTRPEYRTKFYGMYVREMYLQLTGNVRRQIMYVREKKMQLFHKRFGFNADGFENRVFVFDDKFSESRD